MYLSGKGKNAQTQTFLQKLSWKEELLRFQLQDENRSFVDLKIQCSDGYFLAHKIVFAMSSQINWKDKKRRSMDIWIANHKLEEMAKIMFLVYTGETLLINNWTYLDELMKVFQLQEEKLVWGVPYNENNNLFLLLSQKSVRAAKYNTLNGTLEEVLIYGNGDIKPLHECQEDKNVEGSLNFHDAGYPCQFCPCIFIDESDFAEHDAGCRPNAAVKPEPKSPGNSTNEDCGDSAPSSPPDPDITLPLQKRLASPVEILCSVCNSESNSVMKLVEHFHKYHNIIPGKDYYINPIKCIRCSFTRSGMNMSGFLTHVVDCRTATENNLCKTLELVLDSKSSESLIASSQRDAVRSQTPKRKRNAKENENITRKFVIPKKNIEKGSGVLANSVGENLQTGTTSFYRGPLKTPENPDKTLPFMFSEIARKRLIFTADTPKVFTQPKDYKFGSSIASTSPQAHLEDTMSITLPTVPRNRKKRKRTENIYVSQQDWKRQKTSNSFDSTKVKTELTTTIATPKYKWYCGYCKSKFKTQIFYMRHCCRKPVASLTPRPPSIKLTTNFSILKGPGSKKRKKQGNNYEKSTKFFYNFRRNYSH